MSAKADCGEEWAQHKHAANRQDGKHDQSDRALDPVLGFHAA
jgi:hypothetical protein